MAMKQLTIRERAIKLIFELPEKVLQKTVKEWEQSLHLQQNTDRLCEALTEVAEAKKGRRKLKDVKDFLNECKNSDNESI